MPIRSVVVRYSANMTDLLRDLDRGAKANDRLAQSSEKAGARIDRNAKIAAGLTLAVGASIAKFAEFDSVMSQVAAATGKTGAELNTLRDAAVQAGRDTQFSATEAAQGITELAKAGLSAKEILEGGLTGALNLAAAGQLSVAESAETMASALAQFSLDGAQASHVADLLAAGANKAQGSVHDMGAALNQAGLIASQTGLSVEETTAGLTAFANAGLLGSDAGTSFKTMLQRLTPQSAEAAEEMDRLGISAYDAQGQFIGLEAFAGNLREAMAKLTPEARASAMNIIFGSDAVRAANVLYLEGADGIRGWTNEVDQTGFAAEQARVLTDNLRGDVERLGGAFETNLISAGSGANDTMRSIVQTGERLLEVIGAIPGPVLTGAAAFGALALVGPKVGQLGQHLSGPFKSGAETVRLVGMYARDATGPVNKLSAAGGALKSSFGGVRGAASGLVGMLGGPWGLALTGAAAGLTFFAGEAAKTDQIASQLQSTIDKATGSFTAQSKAGIVQSLLGDLAADDIQLLKQLGVNFDAVATNLLKGGPAADAQRKALVDLMNVHQSGLGIFSSESLATEGLLRSYDRATDGAERARIVFSETGGSIDGLGEAAKTAGPSLQDLADKNLAIEDTAAKAAQATTDIADAILAVSDAAISADAAAADYEAALDAATEAAEKNGKTANKQRTELDLTTEAGRDNAAALRELATDAKASAEAMLNNGESAKTTKAKMAEAREEFINVATKMGLSKTAARELATQYGLTDESVDTLITSLGDVPKEVVSKLKADKKQADAEIKKLQAQLAAMRKTYDINIRINQIGAGLDLGDFVGGSGGTRNAAGGIVTAYAGGGIRGPVTAFAGGGFSPDVANAHVAHIVPAGAYRVFGEAETQGEAYIPFANDWRRPRARGILQESARRLGGNIQWNAAGSISARSLGGGGTADIDYGRLAIALRSAGPTTINVHEATADPNQLAAVIDWQRKRSR